MTATFSGAAILLVRVPALAAAQPAPAVGSIPGPVYAVAATDDVDQGAAISFGRASALWPSSIGD